MGLPTLISGTTLLATMTALIYLAYDAADKYYPNLSDEAGVDQVVLVTGQTQFVAAVMCFATAFVVFALYEQTSVPDFQAPL